VLLLFQAVGELLHASLGVPLPGPVIGMALLTLVLARRPSPNVERAASGLLDYMPILFVPAGVGVSAFAERLRQVGCQSRFALVGSTRLALVVSALAMKALVASPPVAASEDRAECAQRSGTLRCRGCC
jgi:holin-like protein